VLHIMAIVQLRNDTEGRACYRRKLAAGKTSTEAIRCLKRRLPGPGLPADDQRCAGLSDGPGRTHGDGYWL
jgi:transposase